MKQKSGMRVAHLDVYRKVKLLWSVAVVALLFVTVFGVFSVIGQNRAHAVSQSALDALQPVVSAEGFTHPGVFVTLDELKATKAKVQAGEAPWSTIFGKLAASSLVTRTASDFSEFLSAADISQPCSLSDPSGCIASCGPNGIPNYGCSVEQGDAKAVYAQALMYWYTGDDAYAQRAIGILNAYADHFKGHQGSNGPLVAAWGSAMMVRGAEILRYTYTPAAGDTAFNVAGFSAMLRSAFVDRLTSFDWYRVPSNWMGSATDGMMNAAVFLNDRALYNQAVGMWRDYVPNYIYTTSDGAFPKFLDVSPIHNVGYVGIDTPEKQTNLKCFWLYNKAPACQDSPKTDPGNLIFQNGQTQETCRDMEHTAMGISGAINVAETNWIQGGDLYGEQQNRIMRSIEYAVQIAQSYPTSGWPTNFCLNIEDLNTAMTLNELAVEVAYNAYTVRKGVSFGTLAVPGYSQTYANNDPVAAFVALRRSSTNNAGLVTGWETLTHHKVAAIDTSVDPGNGGDGGASTDPVETPTTPKAPNTGEQSLAAAIYVVASLGIISAVGVVLYRRYSV